MIVTMFLMRVVQVATDDVVHVISVWHGFVSTLRTVRMGRFVPTAGVRRSARGRIHLPRRDDMLVDVPLVNVMKVAVVKVVFVPFVLDRLVATVGTMLMVVLLVHLVIRHHSSFLVIGG